MTSRVKNAVRDPLSHAVIFTNRHEYARAVQRRNRSKEIARERADHEAMKQRVVNQENRHARLQQENAALHLRLEKMEAALETLLAAQKKTKG